MMEIINDNVSITKIGGIASIMSGLCSILGGTLVITAFFIPAIPSLTWGIVFTFRNVLIVFPIIAISYKLSDNGGCLVKAAYISSLSGLLLGLAGFFSPSGWVIYMLGILLLAIANMKNRYVSRTALWLWFFFIIVSMGITYLNIPLIGSGVFPLISGIPIIWVGLNLVQADKGK